MTSRRRAVGIVTRGPASPRLQPIFEALAARDVRVNSVMFDDGGVAETREQLLALDGVLVWVDPITRDQDRSKLDPLLRDVALSGVWVSAHPDVILKMGTKEVLFRTRKLGWGGDTHLFETMEQFAREFPHQLKAGARVVKQNRGNAGIGIWKVELAAGAVQQPDPIVRVQHAHLRDTVVEEMPLSAFLERCSEYFLGAGLIVDQRFEPRVAEGMIRCYLVRNEVAGFSTQSADGPALGRAEPAENIFGLPSSKTMFTESEPRFAKLREQMESKWISAMQELVGVDDDSLPLLWDADFLLGPKTDAGEDTYVLCEINVSCVTPFPPGVVPKIAAAVVAKLAAARPS